jgi:hypothetical protein
MPALVVLDQDEPNFIGYRRRLNELTSTIGNAGLGFIEVPITADATAGINFTVPFDCKIVAAQVICDAANASGTLTVRNVATAITSAMICAVLDTITLATTLLTAQRAQAAGTVLNVISIGGTTANTRGTVLLTVRRN